MDLPFTPSISLSLSLPSFPRGRRKCFIALSTAKSPLSFHCRGRRPNGFLGLSLNDRTTQVCTFLSKNLNLVQESRPDGEGKRARRRNISEALFTHFLTQKSTLQSILSLVIEVDKTVSVGKDSLCITTLASGLSGACIKIQKMLSGCGHYSL